MPANAMRRASRSRAALRRLMTCCRVTLSTPAMVLSSHGRSFHSFANCSAGIHSPGQLANGRDSGQREESNDAPTLLVTQIQQERCALARWQLVYLFPESPQVRSLLYVDRYIDL